MHSVIRNLLTAILLSVTGLAVMGVGIAVGLNGAFAMTAVLPNWSHLNAVELAWSFLVGWVKQIGFVMVPTLIGTGLSAVGVRLLNRGRRRVLPVIHEHRGQGTAPDRWNEVSAGLRGYSDLDDARLCEFQRLWLAAVTSAEPRIQRCLVRVWASRLSPMRWHLTEPLDKQVSDTEPLGRGVPVEPAAP
jgi:hypothetical protein